MLWDLPLRPSGAEPSFNGFALLEGGRRMSKGLVATPLIAPT